MARGFPYASHPTGWFVAGFSDDIGLGEVAPMRYFSQDLVMWRGAEDGKLYCLDAHCGHNGADIGHGGKVDGDCIVCPFHAWKWGPDGKNVDIPYSRILHNNARMRTWHVWEESGIIQLWHDAEGREPYWEPMQLPTNLDAYYPISKTAHVVRGKPMYGQWFIENIADPAHLKYVHLAPWIPSGGRYFWDGPNWTNSEEQRDRARPTFGTQAMSMIITKGHPTQIPLGDYDHSEQVNVAAVTPVDDCVTDVFLPTYMVKEEGYPDEIGPRAQKAFVARVKNITLDFNLFDYMVYRDGPVWPPEESKKWNEVRKWAQQFYPADTGIRSIPPGSGDNTVFEREDDAVIGGQRGHGPAKVYRGSGFSPKVS